MNKGGTPNFELRAKWKKMNYNPTCLSSAYNINHIPTNIKMSSKGLLNLEEGLKSVVITRSQSPKGLNLEEGLKALKMEVKEVVKKSRFLLLSSTTLPSTMPLGFSKELLRQLNGILLAPKCTSMERKGEQLIEMFAYVHPRITEILKMQPLEYQNVALEMYHCTTWFQETYNSGMLDDFPVTLRVEFLNTRRVLSNYIIKLERNALLTNKRYIHAIETIAKELSSGSARILLQEERERDND